jgi:hypothetical protein
LNLHVSKIGVYTCLSEFITKNSQLLNLSIKSLTDFNSNMVDNAIKQTCSLKSLHLNFMSSENILNPSFFDVIENHVSLQDFKIKLHFSSDDICKQLSRAITNNTSLKKVGISIRNTKGVTFDFENIIVKNSTIRELRLICDSTTNFLHFLQFNTTLTSFGIEEATTNDFRELLSPLSLNSTLTSLSFFPRFPIQNISFLENILSEKSQISFLETGFRPSDEILPVLQSIISNNTSLSRLKLFGIKSTNISLENNLSLVECTLRNTNQYCFLVANKGMLPKDY